MKHVQGITHSGTVKNDIRCALLMSEADREVRESMRLSTGRNITYARFNYDTTKQLAALERNIRELPMPVDTSCAPSYWNPVGYGKVIVGRSHAHVQAKRAGRLTFGTAALRAAAQAKTRELMAQRADARRAEWQALNTAIALTSQQ